MKNLPKNTTVKFFIFYMTSLTFGTAQEISTIEAADADISENLDLKAVASLFGETRDLEEFEYKLNDPKTQFSNLDLNEDGNVDYLRIVETAEDGTHLIAIQAVLGEDSYQDVATIDVERKGTEKVHVQVVGDVYLYGPSHIIEPVYVYRPAIFSIFWLPSYRPYFSQYRWRYYPRHYHVWKPFHYVHYRNHIHRHINTRHTYRFVHRRYSTRAVRLHAATHRKDFSRKHPDRSYTARVTKNGHGCGGRVRKTRVNRADGTNGRMVSVVRPDGLDRVVTERKKRDKSRTVRTGRRGTNAKNNAGKRTVTTNTSSGKSKRRS